MDSKVRSAMKWLGIDKAQLTSLKDRTWDELVRICTKEHRPARAVEIAQRLNRHRNRVIIYLGQLRADGRAANVTGGWIPLK